MQAQLFQFVVQCCKFKQIHNKSTLVCASVLCCYWFQRSLLLQFCNLASKIADRIQLDSASGRPDHLHVLYIGTKTVAIATVYKVDSIFVTTEVHKYCLFSEIMNANNIVCLFGFLVLLCAILAAFFLDYR